MSTISHRRRQTGILLIGAIFLLVVLAALGAFILSISSSQQVGHAQDLEGARALSASRTGLEWGMYQVVNGAGYCSGGAASQSLSGVPGLAGLVIQVDCSSLQWTEDATTYRVYTLTSTACNSSACPAASPGSLYVERRMQATLVQ